MRRFATFLTLATPLLFFLACSGTGGPGGTKTTSQPGALFITAEDAPVSTVVAFNVTIKSITVNNGSTSQAVLSTPTAVDFGRLLGLRSLLGFNTVPAGTYDSVTFTFENSNPVPVIEYVNLNLTPPAVQPLTGSFSQSTVTVPFPVNSPLVVGNNGLAGLHIDFNLRDSLVVDSMGNMTGAINPVITVQAVSASEELGEITDLTGNVVSVGTNSFVMQGPYGFQRTIDVDQNTKYNGTNNFSSIMVDGIVSVIGTIQADGSILAKSVEIITTDKAFISGRILAVNPSSGPVQTVTMWVGEELGTSAVYPVDTVQTIDLSGVPASNYAICFFDNILTQQLFDNTSLVVGQRIFIGGVVSGSTFTPRLVSLRRQGVFGTLVLNSVTITGGTGSNQGSFQMQNDALMSYAAGGTFTVRTGDLTVFENINGLAGLAQAGTPNLVVRGLVFKNPTDGKPVIVAGRVRVLPAGQ